jgi:hypothetical protein
VLSHLASEALVFFLEVDDLGDAGEIEALGEEALNAAKAGDVFGAVEAVAARGAVGDDQSGAFVSAEVLDGGADEIGCDPDAINASLGRRRVRTTDRVSARTHRPPSAALTLMCGHAISISLSTAIDSRWLEHRSVLVDLRR